MRPTAAQYREAAELVALYPHDPNGIEFACHAIAKVMGIPYYTESAQDFTDLFHPPNKSFGVFWFVVPRNSNTSYEDLLLCKTQEEAQFLRSLALLFMAEIAGTGDYA